MAAEGGLGGHPTERSLELLSLLPKDIKDAIPHGCLSCPTLHGRLAVYEMFKASTNNDIRSLDPIKKLGGFISSKLSERRIVRDVTEMTVSMENCGAGPLEIVPSDPPRPEMSLCGLNLQDALVNEIQVTE